MSAFALAATVVTAVTTPVRAATTGPPGQLDGWLSAALAKAAPGTPMRVLVNASSLAESRAAVRSSGLDQIDEFPLIGTTVAVGTPAAIRSLTARPGVTLVEGDRPLDLNLDTSHKATRTSLVDANPGVFTRSDGSGPADGTGVSIAIIDGGIQGTHPMFQGPGGSKVVRNLEVACASPLNCNNAMVTSFTVRDDLDGDNNTDTAGHGTHVAGIAAGYPVQDAGGRRLVGAAPGAKLIGLSVAKGASTYYGATAAQYWVLNNHAAPCGGTATAACPAIRVVNNSYGPARGGDFSATSATVLIQDQLADQGVVMVWAAGNDGDQGKDATTGADANRTNPPGNDPKPGVIMVASYDDDESGNPDFALSGFSSRGQKAVTGSYPDISAPGDTIYSSCPQALYDCVTGLSADPNYANLSGTSMATPHIAGYVARLFSADPSLTPAQIENVLEDTAHKFVVPSNATDGAYVNDPLNPDDLTSYDKGHGLVDVAAALAKIKGVAVPGPGLDPCASATYADDPAGDATAAALGSTGTPPVPSDDTDITRIGVSNVAGALRVSVRVVDLPDQPKSPGDAVLGYFGVNGTAYRFYADRSPNPTGPTTGALRISKQTGTSTTGATYGTATAGVATFDASNVGPTANTMYFDVLASYLGVPTVEGIRVGGLDVLWRRSGGAVAAPSDEASSRCPLLVTSASSIDANPTVPEAPGGLLPLAVVGLLGFGILVLRRRRSVGA